MFDRFIRLMLIVPFSTTTIECVSSVMKVIKTKLKNKMDNEFLSNCLIVYIRINNFSAIKERRVHFVKFFFFLIMHERFY